MKKNILTALIMIMMSLMLALTGCGNLFGVDDDDTGTEGSNKASDMTVEELENLSDEEAMDVINNGIEFEEESEETELHFRKSDELEYIGSWEATSGHSIYMYGNLELNILPGGKWNGTIVDEKMSGDWKFEKNQMNLTSEYFNASLSFTDGGKLVLQEDRGDEGEEDIVRIVLTKK